jgi:hypothetical protein
MQGSETELVAEHDISSSEVAAVDAVDFPPPK